jgi:peptide/nickel transport system substrate-binding protein
MVRVILVALAFILAMPVGLALAQEGEPIAGGDLVFARREDNTSLDPAAAVETETIYVLNHIFETLFVTSDDGTDVEPWLATGFEL